LIIYLIKDKGVFEFNEKIVLILKNKTFGHLYIATAAKIRIIYAIIFFNGYIILAFRILQRYIK
jgi:hypothetical protein